MKSANGQEKVCYQLRINGKIVRDRLIHWAHEDADTKVITEGNVVGNILKLYAELDPLACYEEWGKGENPVVFKARQNGEVLTIGDEPFEFKRVFNISTTQERCYCWNHEQSGKEPYWILAPSVEPGYWLVITTDRDLGKKIKTAGGQTILKKILDMCKDGFFKKYGIESVELKKV